MPETRFRSAAEAVAFAVRREIEAAASYARLAGLAKTPGLPELCLFLRDQEEAHRRLLEGLTESDLRRLEPAMTADLGIVDALADEPLTDDMSVQELLIFAARKEKSAAELYEAGGLGRRPEPPGPLPFPRRPGARAQAQARGRIRRTRLEGELKGAR